MADPSGASHLLPQSFDVVLRGATSNAGDLIDVAITAGRVKAVEPAGTVELNGTEEHDLRGHVLLTAPAEPHTHLDKALTWETLQTGHVGLPEAIEAWGRASSTLDVGETRARALCAIDELVAHGVTAVRTHVDVCPGDRPLAAVEALVGVREALTGVVDLQVVLLSRASTPDDLIRAAIDQGVDQVGGAPYMEPRPEKENARLLRLAVERSVDVDLHVDEELDADVASLRDLIQRVEEGMGPGRVTASHCVSLGIQEAATAEKTIAAMAVAGMAVITLPLTNMYLLGRDWPTSPPRAMTAIRRLLDAGVTVAAGGDNVRDPFNPMGRCDPLALASVLVTAAHLTIEEAYDMVSIAARAVLGLPPAGPVVGMTADLLAVRAVSLADAVARSPEDRIVIRGGQVVASTTSQRRSTIGAFRRLYT